MMALNWPATVYALPREAYLERLLLAAKEAEEAGFCFFAAALRRLREQELARDRRAR